MQYKEIQYLSHNQPLIINQDCNEEYDGLNLLKGDIVYFQYLNEHGEFLIKKNLNQKHNDCLYDYSKLSIIKDDLPFIYEDYCPELSLEELNELKCGDLIVNGVDGFGDIPFIGFLKPVIITKIEKEIDEEYSTIYGKDRYNNECIICEPRKYIKEKEFKYSIDLFNHPYGMLQQYLITENITIDKDNFENIIEKFKKNLHNISFRNSNSEDIINALSLTLLNIKGIK